MKRIIFIVFLLSGLLVKAQTSSKSSYVSTYTKKLSQMSSSDTLYVFGNALNNTIPSSNDTSWRGNYCFGSVKGKVSINVVQDSSLCLPESFTCSVTLLVRRFTITNQLISENITLNVDYDKNTGKTFVEQDGRIYDGAYFLSAKVVSVSNTSVKAHLNLAVEIHEERSICLSSLNTTSVPLVKQTTIDSSFIKFYLPLDNDPSDPNIKYADEFDIEWTVIDMSESGLVYNLTGGCAIVNYNFRDNASRVTIGKNDRIFALRNVFENDHVVLFRYRRVNYYKGDNGIIHRITSIWSTDHTTGGTIDNPDEGSCTTGSCFSGWIEDLSNAKTTIAYFPLQNWQYTAVYAEDAKRNESIAYFDGSLRNRQTVTTNNSDSAVLIQDNVYDFMGRQAIQVLPFPLVGGAFKYYPALNKNSTSQTYSAYDFDKDAIAGECVTTIDSMKATNGAAQYYSMSNTAPSMFSKFVPVSDGYPFTQTVFMPDNTGRVRAKSALGKKHQIITGGKYTEYAYETPTQVELTKLFGTEVGFAQHYKKTSVIDANGQASISYTDLKGKTIATALASSPPNNGMDSLASASAAMATIETDLVSGYTVHVSNDRIILTKRINLLEPGTRQFKYSLKPQNYFTPTCGASVCFDCIYDLDISISEVVCGNEMLDGSKATGTQLLHRVIGGNPESVDTTCNASSEYAFETDTALIKNGSGYVEVNLQKGMYDITKVLKVNALAMNNYEQLFMQKNACKTIEEFEQEAYSEMDTTGCELTCEECQTKFASVTKEQFVSAKVAEYLGKGITLAHEDSVSWGVFYDESKKRCAELCGQESICETYLDILKLDIMPGGQYARFKFNDTGAAVLLSTGDDRYVGLNLLANTNNSYKLRYDSLPTSLVVTIDNEVKRVRDLSLDEFIKYWDDSWADSLVKQHPEYCEYEWCLENKAALDFEDSLQNIETYDEAFSFGMIDVGCTPDCALKLIDNDPACTTMEIAWQLKDSVNNYTVINDNGTPSDMSDDTIYTRTLSDLVLSTVFCDSIHMRNTTQLNSCVTSAITNFENCGAYKDVYWQTIRAMYFAKRNEILKTYKECSPNVSGIAGAKLRLSSKNPWGNSIPAPTLGSNTDSIVSGCNEQCDAYKPVWEESLRSCNLDSLQMVEILEQLKLVCIQGCDVNFPMGASSVSPVNLPTATFIAFDSVLKYYPALSTTGAFASRTNIYNPNVCSGVLIKFPQPYGHDYFAKSSAYADTCACADSIPPENCPCNKSKAMSDVNKVVKMSVMNVADSSKCNNCIDCSTFAQVFKSFTQIHAGITEDSATYSDLFENFFNQRLGFNLTYTDYLEFANKCTRGNGVTDATLKQFKDRFILVSTSSVTNKRSTLFTEPIISDQEIRFAQNDATGNGLRGTSALWATSTGYEDQASMYSTLILLNSDKYRGGMSAEQFPGNEPSPTDGIESVMSVSSVPPPTTGPLDYCGCNKILELRYNYNPSTTGYSSGFNTYVTGQLGYSISNLSEVYERCKNAYFTSFNTNWKPGAKWSQSGIFMFDESIDEYSLDVPCAITCNNCNTPTPPPSCDNCGDGYPGYPGFQISQPLVREIECRDFLKMMEEFVAQGYDNLLNDSLPITDSSQVYLLDTLVNSINRYSAQVFAGSSYVSYSRNSFWTKLAKCKNICDTFTSFVGNFITENNLSISADSLFMDQLFVYDTTGLKDTLLSKLNGAFNHYPYWQFFDSTTLANRLKQCNPLPCEEYSTLKDSLRTVYQEELSALDLPFRDQILAPYRRVMFDTLLAWINNISAVHPYHKRYDSLDLTKMINTCTSCLCVAKKDVFLSSFLNELLTEHPTGQTYAPAARRLVSNGWNVQDIQQSFLDKSLYNFAYEDSLTYSIDYISKKVLAAKISNNQDIPFHFMLESFHDNPNDKTFSWYRVTDLSFDRMEREDSCGRIVYFYTATYVYKGTTFTVGVKATADALPFFRKKDCDVVPSGIKLCNKPIGTYTVEVSEDPCITRLKIAAKYNAQLAYNEYLDSLKTSFRTKYLTKCLNRDSLNERFIMKYNEKQYHYTLYYYDQAGNLVKTVPPAGVRYLGDDSVAAIVDTLQNKGRMPLAQWPVNHAKATLYTYNTLNQLVWQQTPDAGASNFYYDKVGRLVVSQNAKQSVTTDFSYTVYDGLGRITQVGQIHKTVNITDPGLFRGNDIINTWISSGTRSQITKTIYDEKDVSVPLIQQNLRGRVASTTYQTYDNMTIVGYEYASHYSYDVQGNVKTLVREIKALASLGQDMKQVDYEYDLVSGKVNRVIYQANEADQYIHQYMYDKDNRLIKVLSGRTDFHLETDAEYYYYLHGPLARTELGKHGVQGVDYAYTINGWLKGVNSETLKYKRDMGRDGDTSYAPNAYMARDEFGFTLTYYDSDYVAAGGSSAQAFIANKAGSGLMGARSNMYNGNIGAMTTAIGKFMEDGNNPLGVAYKYDQLNRITQANYFTNIDTLNNWQSGGVLNAWHNRFTYDADGNILTQIRRSNVASQAYAMDSLNYEYYSGTNRLRRVKDNTATDGYFTDDINNQNDSNYWYDQIGNLVKDKAEEIDSIQWNVYGKIWKIKRVAGSQKPDLEFAYSPDGHRIMKLVIPKKQGELYSYTYYMRDAQGNIMATYERAYNKAIDYDTLLYARVNDSIMGLSNASVFGTFLHSIDSGLMNKLDSIYTLNASEKEAFIRTQPLNDIVSNINNLKEVLARNSNLQEVVEYLATSVGDIPTELMAPCNCATGLGSNPDEIANYWLKNREARDLLFKALYTTYNWHISQLFNDLGYGWPSSIDVPELDFLNDYYTNNPSGLSREAALDNIKSILSGYGMDLTSCENIQSYLANVKSYLQSNVAESAPVIAGVPNYIAKSKMNALCSCGTSGNLLEWLVSQTGGNAREYLIRSFYAYNEAQAQDFMQNYVGAYYVSNENDAASYLNGSSISDGDLYSAFVSYGFNDCTTISYLLTEFYNNFGKATFESVLSTYPDAIPNLVDDGCSVSDAYDMLSCALGNNYIEMMETVNIQSGWDTLLTINTAQYYYNWFKQNRPEVLLAYTAANHKQWISSVQQQNHLYSAEGNGMKAYFENIKQSYVYGQAFYNTLTQNYLKQSKYFTDSFLLSDVQLYGSSRLGTQVVKLPLVWESLYADTSSGRLINTSHVVAHDIEDPVEALFNFVRGTKRYELSNHLGNVLVVISDKKIPVCGGSLVSYYKAEVITATDYSPFGAPLPGRTFDGQSRNFILTDYFNSPTSGWWPVGSSQSVVSGQLKVMPNATAGRVIQWLTNKTKAGKYYIYRLRLDKGTSPGIILEVQNNGEGGEWLASKTITTNGDNYVRFMAIGTSIVVKITTSGYSPGQYFYVDNVEIEEDISVSTSSYRFAFNGQEREDDVSGNGNIYTAEHWQYDSRLGRRWNLDPVYKSDRSNYAAFSNNPIIMIDPEGNDDYYNRKGEYIGTVGGNTGIMRVVDSDDAFKKAQTTNEHQGRVITVDERSINRALIIVANNTLKTGKEYVANIIFDPDKATITAEIDFGGTGDEKSSYPQTKASYDELNNGKVLVGVVHGHPAYSKTITTFSAEGSRTVYITNDETTSAADRDYANNNNVADYAIDAFTIKQTDVFEGTGWLHRANPDGTFDDKIGQMKDVISGQLNLGKDALETTGGKPAD